MPVAPLEIEQLTTEDLEIFFSDLIERHSGERVPEEIHRGNVAPMRPPLKRCDDRVLVQCLDRLSEATARLCDRGLDVELGLAGPIADAGHRIRRAG